MMIKFLITQHALSDDFNTMISLSWPSYDDEPSFNRACHASTMQKCITAIRFVHLRSVHPILKLLAHSRAEFSQEQLMLCFYTEVIGRQNGNVFQFTYIESVDLVVFVLALFSATFFFSHREEPNALPGYYFCFALVQAFLSSCERCS
jgi:hypothetical protein